MAAHYWRSCFAEVFHSNCVGLYESIMLEGMVHATKGGCLERTETEAGEEKFVGRGEVIQ